MLALGWLKPQLNEPRGYQTRSWGDGRRRKARRGEGGVEVEEEEGEEEDLKRPRCWEIILNNGKLELEADGAGTYT